MIRLWAHYSLAVLPGMKTDAAAKLAEAARTPDDNGKLAAMLLAAKERAARGARTPSRRGHALAEDIIIPQAAKIWEAGSGTVGDERDKSLGVAWSGPECRLAHDRCR